MVKILRQYFTLLLPFLWKDRRAVLTTLVTMILTGIDVLIVPLAPWLFSEIISRYPHDTWTSLQTLVFLLIVCRLLIKTIKKVRGIIFFYIVNSAIAKIKLAVISHFHAISLQKGDKYNPSEVLSASTRVSMSVRFCLRVTFLDIIPRFLKLLACSGTMLYLLPSSKYFLLGILATYGYVAIRLRRVVHVRNRMWEKCDEVMVAMGDSLRQKAFAKLHPEIEKRRLSKLFDQELASCARENLVNSSIRLGQNFLFFVVSGIFFLYMVKLLQSGTIKLKVFILLNSNISLIYKQVFYITGYVRGLSTQVVNMKKVLNILSIRTEEQERSAGKAVVLNSKAPLLALDKVSFKYKQNSPSIIDKVSLEVKRGDKILITGVSGRGKSTLAKILAGIYLPTEGDTLFKGVSTRDLKPSLLGKDLYFLAQNSTLHAGSIKDNLLMNVGEASGVLDYFKDAMDAHSKELSGGEQQRILLARCMSYKPEAVILDEAFSSLDQESGRALFRMILEKIPTVILMTHRKDFYKEVDRVYELVDGKLLAR